MTTIENLLGADARLATLLGQRRTIMELTEASGTAVLTPREPGGLPHGLRAAIALRAAAVQDEELMAHYRAMLEACPGGVGFAAFAVPGTMPEDARLAAILRHADLLTAEPRQATRDDIEALKAAGVTEPDIVRLAELCAFLAYQARLLMGFRLLRNAR
ncbi:CMD domain-containing protein [Geminicoccus flavidas]|uniref:CMD domain-containing protein n=1 Tax=Geminicoccus flavidas TaxID=2506407 RepID=UPI00135832CB|nr:hypothetical protein [Geminicoccus flavidas]